MITFTVETCDSAATLCRGSSDDIAPTDLARQLSRTIPLYLIVDFRRLGMPVPEDVATTDYLFNWLDAPTAALVSPLVIAATEMIAWPQLVSEGWGRDAVICLFSQRDKEALLDSLRQLLRPQADTKGPTHGLLAYCWPGALTSLLSGDASDFAGQFLAGIDAVLLERPGQPEMWQIFGNSTMSERILSPALEGL